MLDGVKMVIIYKMYLKKQTDAFELLTCLLGIDVSFVNGPLRLLTLPLLGHLFFIYKTSLYS